MSGAQIAAEVTAALASLGSEVGAGAFDVSIIRMVPAPPPPPPDPLPDPPPPPPAPIPPWELPAVVEQAIPVVANVMMYSRSLIDGTLIKDGDRRVMIAANGPVPSTSDRLRIAGTDYSIVNVEPYEPQGVVLYFEVQARV
jgi:hypothetical protein